MDGVTAIIVISAGLAVTMLIGMASQRRSRVVPQPAPRAASSPPPPMAPTQEQQEDLDAVNRSIEEAREELLWLREQVARERARLERLRHQGPPAGGTAQGGPSFAPPPPIADSPWVVLGLKPGASPDDVRRRYRLLSRVWHPDRFVDAPPELRAEAEQMMARLNRAHRLLTSGQTAHP